MPKIRCICDHVISLGDIPSPNQSLLISDQDFEKFEGQVDSDEIYRSMKIVAHCNNCNRLHIFYDGFNQAPIIYKVDE